MKNLKTWDLSRRIKSILVMICVAMLLAACDGGSKKDPASEETQASKDGVTEDAQQARESATDLENTTASTAESTTGLTAESTAEPTAEPTTQSTTEPTAQPTAEPTPEPTQTPVPELSKDPMSYGDLTSYFMKAASEVIRDYDRPYRYEYWGPDHETETYGGFTFDEMVYFGFEYSGENFDASKEVDTLIIYNNKSKKLNVGIGGDLNVKMTFSEIKNVMGEWLHGPVASGDGTQYIAYGYYQYHNYYFTWKQSPLQKDVPAESVMVYDRYAAKHADSIAYDFRKPVQKYLEDNKKLISTHKEQLLKELRADYQYEPVCKCNFLTTIQADAHNAVEVYEFAAYGCPPTYEKKTDGRGLEEFIVNGVDKSKELYSYRVMLRILTDGQVFDYFFYFDEENDQDFLYWEDAIYGGISWLGADELEVNALREMIGIPGKQKECVVTCALTKRPITEDGWSLSENFTAYYLNGSKTPCLIDVSEAYESNDGGLTQKVLQTADGQDLLNERKLVREGKGILYGCEVTWKLYDTPSGIPVVTTFKDDGNYTGTWKEYVIIDDCLITVYSFSSVV